MTDISDKTKKLDFDKFNDSIMKTVNESEPQPSIMNNPKLQKKLVELKQKLKDDGIYDDLRILNAEKELMKRMGITDSIDGD